MQAPVVGHPVAEQVDRDSISSFDVTELRIDRFARSACSAAHRRLMHVDHLYSQPRPVIRTCWATHDINRDAK
jgi:hypothetical protein